MRPYALHDPPPHSRAAGRGVGGWARRGRRRLARRRRRHTQAKAAEVGLSNAKRSATVWAVGDGADGGDEARRVAEWWRARKPGPPAVPRRRVRQRHARRSSIATTAPSTGASTASRRPRPATTTGPTTRRATTRTGRQAEPRAQTGTSTRSRPPAGSSSASTRRPAMEEGRRRRRWLKRRVREPGTCRIAFWHRPFLNAGRHGDQKDTSLCGTPLRRPRRPGAQRARPQHPALQAHRGHRAADLGRRRARVCTRATSTTRGWCGTRTTRPAPCASTCGRGLARFSFVTRTGQARCTGQRPLPEPACGPYSAADFGYWITGSSLPPKPGAAAIAGACITGSSRGVAAIMPRASCSSACAAGASGSSTTSGTPLV